MRTALAFFFVLIIYGLLILGVSFSTPLRLSEITQAAAFLNFEWRHFFTWVANTPAGAPLHYLAELPFALSAPDIKVLLRIPSLISAILSVYLFFALAKRVPLRHPTLALLLFLVIPTHLVYATQARPYELALCFSLLATLNFFAVVEEPTIPKSILYGILLVCCLYTQPSSYIPFVGATLALLAFASVKTYRRALWHTLVATAIPPVVFLPYFVWATQLRRGEWLSEQFPALAIKIAGIQTLMGLDPGNNPALGIALLCLMLVGLASGIAAALPMRSVTDPSQQSPSTAVMRRQVMLLCLGAGVLVTLLSETAVSGWTGVPFYPYQIMWALPGLIIVASAALDSLFRLPAFQRLSLVGAVILILAIGLCIPGDWEYLSTPPPDMAKLTALVRPQIENDTCVVFVSQRLSRYLFEVYDPALAKYECQNFFHKRIVLAIHPFVRPESEKEARMFFQGLDFKETHRETLGGGKVITIVSNH